MRKSKNANFIGARNLRKIRIDLGVTQKELECQWAQNISQLENCIKPITEVSAKALVIKINEILGKQGRTLDYEITEKILLGEVNIITNDILKKLDSEVDITKETISDVDNNLEELPNEAAIEFINDVIQILYKDDYKNAHLVRKYALKLLNLDLNFDEKMVAYKHLIIAYSGLRKYDDVTYTAESIESDIAKCRDKKVKISCYSNIAVAYYKQERYEDSMYYYKKLKQLGKANEFFYLTLEAAIAMMNNDFKKAEKIYLNILDKANKIYNNDYIVDAYSNLAIMYKKMRLITEAKENIERSLISINCGTSKMFKLNAYLNAFFIYDAFFGNDIEIIEDYFDKVLPLAIELNDMKRLNSLLEKIFSRYIEHNDFQKIYRIIPQLNGLGINPDILLNIIKNIGK